MGHSAQQLLSVLVAYVLEALPEQEHSLESVCWLYQAMEDSRFDGLFQELEEENPNSFAVRAFRMTSGNKIADQTYACIKMFQVKNLIPLSFDGIISIIRSREVYVSLIIQSITQLYSLYEDSRGKTIINNCDNCLYLGGQDIDTSRFISIRANRTQETILRMPLDDAWLFTRGQKAEKVEFLLSGRGRPVMPELEDGDWLYSEEKAGALISQLLECARFYYQARREAELKAKEQACLRNFFYCALRLSADRPAWLPKLTGTFQGLFGEPLFRSGRLRESHGGQRRGGSAFLGAG